MTEYDREADVLTLEFMREAALYAKRLEQVYCLGVPRSQFVREVFDVVRSARVPDTIEMERVR